MYTEMKALQSTILSGKIWNEKQNVTVCIKNIHIFIISLEGYARSCNNSCLQEEVLYSQETNREEFFTLYYFVTSIFST